MIARQGVFVIASVMPSLNFSRVKVFSPCWVHNGARNRRGSLLATRLRSALDRKDISATYDGLEMSKKEDEQLTSSPKTEPWEWLRGVYVVASILFLGGIALFVGLKIGFHWLDIIGTLALLLGALSPIIVRIVKTFLSMKQLPKRIAEAIVFSNCELIDKIQSMEGRLTKKIDDSETVVSTAITESKKELTDAFKERMAEYETKVTDTFREKMAESQTNLTNAMAEGTAESETKLVNFSTERIAESEIKLTNTFREKMAEYETNLMNAMTEETAETEKELMNILAENNKELMDAIKASKA